MFDVDDDPNRTFCRLQERQHCVSRRVFEKPDQPWRTQNPRHSAMCEVDQVLLINDEYLFADGADFRDALQLCSILQTRAMRCCISGESATAANPSAMAVRFKNIRRFNECWIMDPFALLLMI